ncbi:MAG: hypothetical protein D6773_03210, partial [Alphaproteobacteria bacterium]
MSVFYFDEDRREYRELLEDYLVDELGLERGDGRDDGLIAEIIAAAEGKFVYVSFLADRCKALGLKAVRALLADAPDRRGSALYEHWLAGLEREYGSKEADAIRDLLAVLAAAEEAHGWVFDEGARPDPVDGTPLTLLEERFDGLPLVMLARLLHADEVEGGTGVDPLLMLRLERIQGVLWASRGGEATTRFRIGLKDLLPVLQADDEMGRRIRRAHARLASEALDLVARLSAEDMEIGEADAGALQVLVPLLEASVVLGGSEPVAERFKREGGKARDVLLRLQRELAARGHGSGRAALWSQVMALCWHPRGAALMDLPLEQRNELAGSLTNRGVARATQGNLARAIADLDAAIEIREALRQELEPRGEW